MTYDIYWYVKKTFICCQCNQEAPMFGRYDSKNKKCKSCLEKLSIARNTERVCIQCGKKFIPKYKASLSVQHLESLEFCSHTCSSEYRKWDTKELEEKVISTILLHGRYIDKRTLQRLSNISTNTLKKHGLNLTDINNSLGYYSRKNYINLITLKYLLDLGIEASTEKSFNGCRSKLGKLLRFDIYIEYLNIVIELDDPSHWDEKHHYFNEEVMERDSIKNDYCTQNGISLYRIRFTNVCDWENLVKPKIDKIIKSNQQLGYLETSTNSPETYAALKD